jgi:hypothetical protein
MRKLPGTEVTNFMRGPTWVYYRVPPSKHLGRETDDPNPEYTEEEKRNWRENPEELRKYRKGMIHRTNRAFQMVCPLPEHIRDAFADDAALVYSS